MRSDPIAQDADVVISALNEKIQAYQKEINDRKEIIRQLEEARRLHEKSVTPIRIGVDIRKPRKSKKGKKSKKARIIEAIENRVGKFNSKDLWYQVNNDGHGTVDKATFYSTFSRLKEGGQCFKETDEKGFYEKIVKG